MASEIQSVDDIKTFVNAFYGKVRTDELIGPIFNARISDWDFHLNKMYRFWNTVLFSEPGYNGNPFAKHAPLGLEEQHFERWLALFKATIDDLFTGAKASETKLRAAFMATMFKQKLAYMRENGYHSIQ